MRTGGFCPFLPLFQTVLGMECRTSLSMVGEWLTAETPSAPHWGILGSRSPAKPPPSPMFALRQGLFQEAQAGLVLLLCSPD